MPGSWKGHSIRLELISGNLKVPSERIPGDIYISINAGARRLWKSAIRVVSSDVSIAWCSAVTLSLLASPPGRMLGNGEVIGKLETSWDELLDHGEESFDIFILPPLTLKTAVVRACDNQDSALFDSIVDCEIARDTDAGHARFVEYTTSEITQITHYLSIIS